MNEKDLRAERRKGIFFIILAGVFFSLMSAFVRLSGDLPVMEKAFFRNLIAAIAAWIIIFKEVPQWQEKQFLRQLSLQF